LSEANEKIVNEVLMKKHKYKCPLCKSSEIKISQAEHGEKNISFHCDCLKQCSVYGFSIYIEEKLTRKEIPSDKRDSKLELSCPNCLQKMKVYTETWEDDCDEDSEIWAFESLCDNPNCNVSWVGAWIFFKKRKEVE